jgi:hypothetical protein
MALKFLTGTVILQHVGRSPYRRVLASSLAFRIHLQWSILGRACANINVCVNRGTGRRRLVSSNSRVTETGIF